MRLISFQSKAFANRVVDLFNDGANSVDYDNIDNVDFYYSHSRVKDIYDDEDFIYCFEVFRNNEIELRKCLYENIFKDFTTFIKYYKLTDDDLTLLEFDVPESIGISGKISSCEILSEEFISSQYDMPFNNYISLTNNSLYEKVLPEIKKEWLVDIYDISHPSEFPKSVTRFIHNIKPRNYTSNKCKLFKSDTILVNNPTALKIAYYEYTTKNYCNVLSTKDDDYDMFLKSEDYRVIENLIIDSDNNVKEFINSCETFPACEETSLF